MSRASEERAIGMALALADEYRVECDRRGRCARTIQIRNTIDDLVGRRVDGKFILPRVVLERMGLAR